MRLIQNFAELLMGRWTWERADTDTDTQTKFIYLPIWIFIFFLLNISGGLDEGCIFGEQTGFLTKTVEVNGQEDWYWIYVPSTYDDQQEWPMIVYLGGLLQWGSPSISRHSVLPPSSGIGPTLMQKPELYPCLVVWPQVPFPFAWFGRWELVQAVIDDAKRRYSIDDDRLILTGISSGGIATYQFGAAHTELFAGLVPIGASWSSDDAGALAQIPIWAFHGSLDTTIEPAAAQATVQAIRDAGGNVLYTEYPDLTHFNTWDRAYADPEVAAWMMSQTRAKQETNSAETP